MESGLRSEGMEEGASSGVYVDTSIVVRLVGMCLQIGVDPPDEICLALL
jgi:hypothetical protein